MNMQGQPFTQLPVSEAELLGGDQLDQLVERRSYWLLTGITMLALAGFGATWAIKGGYLNGALCLLALLILGATAAHVTRQQPDSVRRHLHVSILVLYVLVGLGAWLQGGLQAPALRWLGVLPFIALVSGSTRLGVSLALAFVVQSAAMAMYVPAYVVALRPLMMPSPEQQLLGATIGSVLIFAIFGGMTLSWRRKAHAMLDHARHKAKQGEAAKERFLATISHEIRTPLNGIIGVASLLRKGSYGTHQHAQLVDALERSAHNLLHMLNDVLDWTKMDHEGIRLLEAPFDLHDLVQECTLLYAASAQAKGVAVSCACDQAVPRRFTGDATRIRQVLNNLLSNAVKFTSEGSVHVQVSLAGTEASSHVEIAVRDTGLGMPPARIEALFKPFQQLDESISRRFGGTGLGLSIALALVQAMEGRIEVHSRENQGTCFSVHLPLKAAQDAPGREAASPIAPPPIKVLVVEDNEINQWVLDEMLQSCGVSAAFVDGGPMALERIEAEAFDLIMLDYHMPGMDGLTTLGHVREMERRLQRPRARAVMASADMLVSRDPRFADIDAMVGKPFAMDQLQAALGLPVTGTPRPRSAQPTSEPHPAQAA